MTDFFTHVRLQLFKFFSVVSKHFNSQVSGTQTFMERISRFVSNFLETQLTTPVNLYI